MKKRFPFPCLLFYAFLVGQLHGSSNFSMDVNWRIEPLGNANLEMIFRFDAETISALQMIFPEPISFVNRSINPEAWSGEARDSSAEYDESRNSLVFRTTLLGAATNHGRYWTMPLGAEDLDVDPIKITDSLCIFKMHDSTGEMGPAIQMVELPAGASGVEYRAERNEIRYSLPDPPMEGDVVELDCSVDFRDRAMTALYKQYGSPEFPEFWLAKCLFENTGDVPLTDFRVRFSLGEYSDGFGESTEVEEILPGQFVATPYHPILTSACTKIRSATPAKLRIEYSYKLPNGTREEHDIVRRLTLLGSRDFVFTDVDESLIIDFEDAYDNARFLSAWVTPEDPVVAEFGAMANELADGAGAHIDNLSAITVAAGIYEMMRGSRISYQSPAGLFNSHDTQHLKYPRDTLRDRSGTCIDLSIAFAAFAEAQGLSPVLILVPGHCYAGFYLPESGEILAVELTLLAGGGGGGSSPFEKAVEVGMANFEEHQNDGNIILVDTGEMRQMGVYPPELGPLPADALAKWGIGLDKLVLPEVMEDEAVEDIASNSSEDPVNLENAEIFDLTLSRYPDPEGRFSILIPDGFNGQETRIGSFFSSPNEEILIQVFSVPRILDGLEMDEMALLSTFFTVNEVEPGEGSELSDPIDIEMSGISSVGRDMTLRDADNNVLLRATTVFNAPGDRRFLFAFAAQGELLDSGNDEALGQLMLLVARSMRLE